MFNFANKSWTQANVLFLHYFCHLDYCGGYAWGAGALTYLYKRLGDAGFANTKQLDGYAIVLQVIITTMVTLNIENLILDNQSLLLLLLKQAWIYEHFPTIS